MHKLKSFVWNSLQDAFLIHGKDFAKEKKSDNFPKEDVVAWLGLQSRVGNYDPFYYYYHSVPEKVSVDVLGNTKGYEHKIHTLFASVDVEDTERIVRLVQHFGLLEKPNRKFDEEWNQKQPLGSSLWLLDSVTNIQSVLKVYKSVFYLIYLARRPGELDLKEIGKILTKNIYYELVKINVEGVKTSFIKTNYDEFMLDLKTKNVDSSSKQMLWALIMEHLSEIIAKTPASIQFDNNLNSDIYWQTLSNMNLIDALYLMLIMDIAEEKRPPKLCVEVTCNNFFTPSRPQGVYCSVICQNRSTIKKFREKNKSKQTKNQGKK